MYYIIWDYLCVWWIWMQLDLCLLGFMIQYLLEGAGNLFTTWKATRRESARIVHNIPGLYAFRRRLWPKVEANLANWVSSSLQLLPRNSGSHSSTFGTQDPNICSSYDLPGPFRCGNPIAYVSRTFMFIKAWWPGDMSIYWNWSTSSCWL